MNNKSGNITWNELKFILPFAMTMITVIFFIANISFNVANMQTQQIEIRSQIQKLSDNQDGFKIQQNQQGQDIAVIKNILQHNNLSLATSSAQKKILAYDLNSPSTAAPSAVIAPDPVTQSAPATTNQNVKKNSNPEEKSSESPTPTPGALNVELLGVKILSI